jgi:hypothetical protein
MATLGVGMLLASVVGVVVTPIPPTGALEPTTADQPRSGFHLPDDGTAAGGWIGSRRTNTDVVYRVDPKRGPVTSGFGGGFWVDAFEGSGPLDVSRARTRRAAWLVAKYGTYRSKPQSAAVEVALHTLLYGGGFALGGAKAEGRLRRTGSSDDVVAMAEYMLEHSKRLAGPYRIEVTAAGAVIGAPAAVTVRVTALGSGAPVPKLPVVVSFAGAQTAFTTGARGMISGLVPTVAAGPQPVRVTVSKLPSDSLWVRRPQTAGASRVVVAGRKFEAVRDRSVDIVARPRVGVSAPDVRTIRDPVPGTIHVRAGYPSVREATLTLHGPYPSLALATCDPAGSSAPGGNVTVEANGPYPVPALDVAEEGVYRWELSVAGNRFNLPATACGEPVLVKAVPLVQLAVASAVVAVGTPTRARMVVSGLPLEYADDGVARLYGPFATRGAIKCVPDRLARQRVVPLAGPATAKWTDPVTVTQAGFYAWQAVVPSGPLSTRELTTCGAPGTTFHP